MRRERQSRPERGRQPTSTQFRRGLDSPKKKEKASRIESKSAEAKGEEPVLGGEEGPGLDSLQCSPPFRSIPAIHSVCPQLDIQYRNEGIR